MDGEVPLRGDSAIKSPLETAKSRETATEHILNIPIKLSVNSRLKPV